ncbi:lysine 2,3-aminomutase [Candidatus Roizmanbacteria bacterium CG09_land_8_20_14_0_10_41_9]|uniref:Lysine 2,3-aminomutase n=1 Tax=Candidatus Roizmanbacteria bacterium CG09_land_8_20_14_0_10_41_9 TaxID=1974850 RepID=A0A2H0WTQ2_9BACT|nr:MAG: lysine 2,3-aminomutase [Candidatus Roizmanbacteria bacterium CG09_land_8_20_14_0_10_41_9]
MIFKVSRHLKKIAKKSPAVKKQYYVSDIEGKDVSYLSDPLLEEEHTKVRGLIHKYKNRVLILLTLNCAAYCRFCTRRRDVSQVMKGVITENDLKRMKSYMEKHPQIKEIILSGGDPFTVPALLEKALKMFSSMPQIKVIRIGTRIPVSDPKKIDKKLIKILSVVKKQPLYVMIHFEHPDEITKETEQAVLRLRKSGAILFSQSVFLKGVNDSFDTLYVLFSRLIEIGVKPYYLFRCDPVKGTEHFIVDIRKEIEIASKLRRNLSGLASPMYIIDVPEGNGKVPVPLNFWDFKLEEYRDFEGKAIKTGKFNTG